MDNEALLLMTERMVLQRYSPNTYEYKIASMYDVSKAHQVFTDQCEKNRILHLKFIRAFNQLLFEVSYILIKGFRKFL